MAKVGDNIITTGLSGKLGDLIVFRNRGGKTIVSKAPKRKTQNWTEAQLQHRERFQEAVIYAKGAIKNESRKAAYLASASNGKTAYNVALADFLNAPHINEIDVSNYTGQPGSFIRVRAVDDFQVAEVTVTILNAEGAEVEHGTAELQSDERWWQFTATVANASIEGDKIIVRVSDLPGNLTEGEKVV